MNQHLCYIMGVFKFDNHLRGRTCLSHTHKLYGICGNNSVNIKNDKYTCIFREKLTCKVKQNYFNFTYKESKIKQSKTNYNQNYFNNLSIKTNAPKDFFGASVGTFEIMYPMYSAY